MCNAYFKPFLGLGQWGRGVFTYAQALYCNSAAQAVRLIVYMTKQEFYDHVFDFFKGIAAVVVVAVGQSLVTYLFHLHPELFTGVVQSAAAIGAVKFIKF